MEEKEYYIETTKYLLKIKYQPDENTIQMFWTSKMNNGTLKYFIGTVPHELLDDEDTEEVYRKVRKYRTLRIEPSLPAIYIQVYPPKDESLLEDQTKQINQSKDSIKQYEVLFKDMINQQGQSKYNKRQAKKIDKFINYGVRYEKSQAGNGEAKIFYDPHNSQTVTQLIQKEGHLHLKIVEQIFSGNSLPKMIKSPFITLAKAIPELKVEIAANILQSNSVIIPPKQQQEYQQKWPGKIALFRQIFLTELIAHMIINQFGVKNTKQMKLREDFQQIQYGDESLQELRRWGHRFYKFRDHPIKWKKNKKKCQENEQDSLDEEEGTSSHILLVNIGEKIKSYYDGSSSNVKNMKDKKEEEICNFTFISGQEKSKINKMRYCLCQMARETDHTQALMDFIYLVFQVVPIESLKGKQNKKKKKKFSIQYQEEDDIKRGEMSEFLNSFKVKRDIDVCLRQYYKRVLLPRIINIGLRLLRTPYELVYLRLPFFHIFWSIKTLYHRHKRAIFHHKQKKNQGRTIKLFRGCSLTQKEIEALKDSMGGYIEAEGFLSTSIDEQIVSAFATNLVMVIVVPVKNLKGMDDNGFSQISDFSEHPKEKEVLFNAFNVFQVLQLKEPKVNEKYYTVYLEYGVMKGVEQKVGKSEDLIVDEYKWRLDKKEILKIKKKLEINEERMSKHWLFKLTTILTEEERKMVGRKKVLNERAKKEYQKAVDGLSQWEKQLLLNTKHQKKKIEYIENYGNLLFEVGEYRKGCIYMRRRIKQVELDRAVLGHHWRSSECLIQKQLTCRHLLYHFFWQIGRVKESYTNMEKLLDVQFSLSMDFSDKQSFCLLLSYVYYL